MKTCLNLALVGSACLIVAGCNPPAQNERKTTTAQANAEEGNNSQRVSAEVETIPAKQQGTPPFVRSLWERSVEIAKPCENAAAVLADRLAFMSPQNAKPEAQKGLHLCESALEKQNALRVPSEAEGDLAVTLDAAIHKCREALDARRKFFESSILVLEGDTSRWRTGMVSTSSLAAQGRSEDCIALFREAGLEI